MNKKEIKAINNFFRNWILNYYVNDNPYHFIDKYCHCKICNPLEKLYE